MDAVTTLSATLGHRAGKVFQRLLADIRRGEFPANTRLPTERELCDRYRVGRHSVRQALARLAGEGHIATRQGSGSIVRPTGDVNQVNVISVMYDGSLSDLTRVQDLALSHGCVLGYFSQRRRHWQPDVEAAFLRQVGAQRHRALLAFCSPVEPRNEALLAELAAQGVRVIHIEHYREALPDEAFILPDYRAAGYAGATSLMLGGYERLLYVAMPEDGPFAQLVEQGFLEALNQQRGGGPTRRLFGRDPEPTYFHLPRVGIDADAEERVRALLSTGGRLGLLCSTTDRAAQLIGRYREAGWRVPEDVGVIAVETLPFARVTDCPLDILTFDRMAIFARAIEAATEPAFSGPRELVAPRLDRQGSCVVPTNSGAAS